MYSSDLRQVLSNVLTARKKTFISQQGDNICIECKKKITVFNAIQFSTVTLPLYPGTKLMMWHVDSSQNDVTTKLGEVIANPK